MPGIPQVLLEVEKPPVMVFKATAGPLLLTLSPILTAASPEVSLGPNGLL